MNIMKFKTSLKESILDNIENSMSKGDVEIKKIHSAGSKLEIQEVFGDETVLMNVLGSKLEKAIANFTASNDNKIYSVIDRFDSYYCGDMLSKSMKQKIYNLITYIENFELDDTNTDFDDKKIKDSFCKDLTNDLKSKGIMSNAEFHNEAGKAGGGDKKGLFMLALQGKQYRFVMLFKIKK